MDNQEKILIIEDDALFQKTLVNMLTKRGYMVKGVKDSQEAFTLTKNSNFDIIITDVKLSGDLDGIDIVRKIKQNHPENLTKIIVMTGYAGEEAPIRAIKLGVDDYIYKPFQMDTFIHTVENNCRILQYEKNEKNYISELETMKEKLAQHNTELEIKLKEEASKLKLIFETSQEFASFFDLTKVLNLIIERISHVLHLERCSVLLFNEKEQALFIVASIGMSDEVIKSTKIKNGERIAGWVFENKKPVMVSDINADDRFEKAYESNYYTGSFICVPLMFKGEAIGVINANNKSSREVFNGEDFKVMQAIADQASIAIENAKLYSNIEDLYLQIMSSLTSIIDAKDHYTQNHSARVAIYALAIAESLEMPQPEIKLLELACKLHDIGKISISEEILNKPEKLTDEELEKIKSHPSRGANILKPFNFLEQVRVIVEQHHERFDGGGYPNGLSGEDIVLGARIIAVCDSFDAIITDRPYSRKSSLVEAIEELKKHKGIQFDPLITDTFVKILENPDHPIHKIKG